MSAERLILVAVARADLALTAFARGWIALLAAMVGLAAWEAGPGKRVRGRFPPARPKRKS